MAIGADRHPPGGEGTPPVTTETGEVDRLYDLDSLSDSSGKNITTGELVERYLATKTAVKPNTLMNYKFVQNVLKGETFNDKKISQIKTSDAKLFLIKLQQDGRHYSIIKTVSGGRGRIWINFVLVLICQLFFAMLKTLAMHFSVIYMEVLMKIAGFIKIIDLCKTKDNMCFKLLNVCVSKFMK